MYYTGTEEECNAYLSEVNTGENYQGTTTTWAEVLKHPSKDMWVIINHPNYESNMTTLDKLPDDWYNNEEL